MSAKLLKALTDENPDLQKQMGCVTGIFQIFDRTHVLSNRVFNGQRIDRLSGREQFTNEFREDSSMYLPSSAGKSTAFFNDQTASIESSRSLSNSSCSSSFSSLSYNKASHEPPSLGRKTSQRLQNLEMGEDMDKFIICNNGSKNSTYLGYHQTNLRGVIKDPINHVTHGGSLTTSSSKPVNQPTKEENSLRVLQLSKSLDGSYVVGINGKSRLHMNLEESLRVLAEASESYEQQPCKSRDESLLRTSKNIRGFSCDRQGTNHSPDARENLSFASKIRESPRFSLDSKQSTVRSLMNIDATPNSKMKDSQETILNGRSLNPQQNSGYYNRRPSVVAKLMGLDSLPTSDVMTSGHNSLEKTELEYGFLSTHREKSSKLNASRNLDLSSSILKSFVKEPTSPRGRTHDPVMKPISVLRFPDETAPWKHLDGVRHSQKTSPKVLDDSQELLHVDSEKKLEELDFQQSSKDLRALKQILDAMGEKVLETSKKHDSPFLIQRNNQKPTRPDMNQRFISGKGSQNNRSRHHFYNDSLDSKTSGSSIVIMKSAKSIGRTDICASSIIPIESLAIVDKHQKDLDTNSIDDASIAKLSKKSREPRNTKIIGSSDKTINRRVDHKGSQKSETQLSQTSSGSVHVVKSTKNTNSLSPKSNQRRNKFENKIQSPSSSELSKQVTQSSRQRDKPSSQSQRVKLRGKFPQNRDQLSDISSETRSSYQMDDVSLPSCSNVCSFSHGDMEATSVDQSLEIQSNFLYHRSKRLPRQEKKGSTSTSNQKQVPEFKEDVAATVVPEHPSPVSVLDTSFCRDDSPSPPKKISNFFEGEDIQNLREDESCSSSIELPCSLDNTNKLDPRLETGYEKLKNVENLVQKLRQLNSSHDEASTDYIASLCERTNPDNRYISEILLASGFLLRDLGPGFDAVQLDQSGHPINPELFFVLEQTKSNRSKETGKYNGGIQNSLQATTDYEKIHRKCIFDTVNEILGEKLAMVNSQNEPWAYRNKLIERSINGQVLLKDLCLEIDRFEKRRSEISGNEMNEGLLSILREDVTNPAENWNNFRRETSSLVLDIERLIFKDLIVEIVRDRSNSDNKKPISP